MFMSIEAITQNASRVIFHLFSMRYSSDITRNS